MLRRTSLLGLYYTEARFCFSCRTGNCAVFADLECVITLRRVALTNENCRIGLSLRLGELRLFSRTFAAE